MTMIGIPKSTQDLRVMADKDEGVCAMIYEYAVMGRISPFDLAEQTGMEPMVCYTAYMNGRDMFRKGLIDFDLELDIDVDEDVEFAISIARNVSDALYLLKAKQTRSARIKSVLKKSDAEFVAWDWMPLAKIRDEAQKTPNIGIQATEDQLLEVAQRQRLFTLIALEVIGTCEGTLYTDLVKRLKKLVDRGLCVKPPASFKRMDQDYWLACHMHGALSDLDLIYCLGHKNPASGDVVRAIHRQIDKSGVWMIEGFENVLKPSVSRTDRSTGTNTDALYAEMTSEKKAFCAEVITKHSRFEASRLLDLTLWGLSELIKDLMCEGFIADYKRNTMSVKNDCVYAQ